MALTGKITGMHAFVDVAPDPPLPDLEIQRWVIIMKKDGAATGIKCVIAEQNQKCWDVTSATDDVPIAPGDRINIMVRQSVDSESSPMPTHISVTLIFKPA